MCFLRIVLIRIRVSLVVATKKKCNNIITIVRLHILTTKFSAIQNQLIVFLQNQQNNYSSGPTYVTQYLNKLLTSTHQ